MANEILKGEMMNEEQLNEVVGGTRGELSCDTKFLHALGLMDDYHEPGYVENHAEEIAGDINAAFRNASIPIRVSYSLGCKNYYRFESGNQTQLINRDQVYRIVLDRIGKTDFDYKKYL